MCTTLLLKAADGAVVSGRTMEFGFDLESNVMIIPAGTKMSGTLPDGSAGLSYTTTYGMLGVNGMGLQVAVDGINEKGLYFSALYFPGFAEYVDVTRENISRALAPHELGNYILGTCATLDEVRTAIEKIVLVKTKVDALGEPAPLHYMVRDRSGNALVIEPIKGTFMVHDNHVGVMTNSPPFDWHMINLSNYSGLTAENVGSVSLANDVTVPQFGQGSGMIGLPGDVTAPSRFIRAVAFTQTATVPKNADDAVNQVFHIMNNFDIPYGLVRDTHPNAEGTPVTHIDYTSWVTVVDMEHGCLYFRTYNDQTIRKIKLDQALKAAGKEKRLIAMNSTQSIVDVSSEFLIPVPHDLLNSSEMVGAR